MKRFLLFAGAAYYPGKGMEDFKGDFISLEAAKDAALTLTDDWLQIYDSEERRIIYRMDRK